MDRMQIEGRGLDLDSVLVSVPSRRVVWASLLTSLTSPSFLTPKIRTDEAAKPFVGHRVAETIRQSQALAVLRQTGMPVPSFYVKSR